MTKININEMFKNIKINNVSVLQAHQLPQYEEIKTIDTQGICLGTVDVNNLHAIEIVCVEISGQFGRHEKRFFALVKSEKDKDEEARWDLVRAYMGETPVTVKLEGIPVKVSLFNEDIVKAMEAFKFTSSHLYKDGCEMNAAPLNKADFLIERGTPCTHKWWQAKCPICGKVESLNSIFAVSYGEKVVVDYDEGSIEDGGLDGKRDKIVLNHGLWAYSKNEPTTQGLIDRVLEFSRLPAGTQICCTERNQFVGGFGVTLKHPEIKAAFGYDHAEGCDAWSVVEDGERYATRNLDRGVQTLSQYKKEVKKNKNLGGYVEVIVKVNVEKDVTAFWVARDFAVGHPHFVMTLAYIASAIEAPLYVVDANTDTKWVPVDTFVKEVVNDGFNVMCRHEAIEDGTTWGHFDYDRSALRWYLFSLLVKRAEQNADYGRKAVIVCGLPGSGKTTFIKGLTDYVTVDPDVVKWLLPEYNGGDATRVHKESVKLSTWAIQYLASKGANLAIQTTSPSTVENLNEMLQELQYDVEVQFVDVDPEICLERIQGRKRSMDITLEKLEALREDFVEYLEYVGYYDNDEDCDDDDDDE